MVVVSVFVSIDSESSVPTGLIATLGNVCGTAAVIGVCMTPGEVIGMSVGCKCEILPDVGTKLMSCSSTCSTSVTSFAAPAALGVMKGDRALVSSPLSLAVAGSILETSFTSAIIRSGKGVADSLCYYATAKWSDVT